MQSCKKLSTKDITIQEKLIDFAFIHSHADIKILKQRQHRSVYSNGNDLSINWLIYK